MVLILDGNSKIGAHVRQEQSLLFDLFKAFDYIECSQKSDFFSRKKCIFFMRAQHVLSYPLIRVPRYKVEHLSAGTRVEECRNPLRLPTVRHQPF